MDLNQLYFEHQSREMQATAAASPEIQAAHRKVASLIAGEIGQLQQAMGAAAAASWTATASRNAINDEPARPAYLATATRSTDAVCLDPAAS